ncbi:E3 ubiquitin-protein ligase PUB22 [Raphanus sativus]|uniref:U-box domain-containing protein n=1 Tax=Raphanus sativus TaxID=3726 RepID=A0A6J0M6Z7_RAPSA|nr:E3 ubiquitin-protein ligase PUB22 [Raphanus sativus]KAJ4890091.1 E3 ubiquitin-protein ligase PUB22 [Raphanus sativus]
MDQEIEIPSFFLCPISLDIMKDPVIVSTGITYDRDSIEKWLFTGKKNSCPVTKQVITETDLTPNHTVRRLIQSWCTLNASYGIERIPTPKPPICKSEIEKLIKDSSSSHQNQVKCLKRLRQIVSQNKANKRCLEAANVPEFLAKIVSNSVDTYNSPSPSLSSSSLNDLCQSNMLENRFDSSRSLMDEALSLLYHLIDTSETARKSLLNNKKGTDLVKTLTKIMQRGIYESRAYATFLLKKILEVADPMQIILLERELFNEVVQILHDQISHKATKSAMQILVIICPWGRNRHKAVEAGAISMIIEQLMDETFSSERRTLEMAMVVLDMLCQCAEGRAEFLNHGAAIAVVSKKILRVSQITSERAVRVLLSIGKFCATPCLLQEMLQLGVVAKMCLVLQVSCGNKTKEKAKELLKLHARAWRESPCVPRNLYASYPA